MKPINFIFDTKRDMHDYVELMQGYSYSFECEFYDDGIEFDLNGYNMSVDMLLANGDYDFRVGSKVVSGNKVTFNTNVISDYTGDAKLQILLEKSGVYTGSWLVNCNVKPSVLNEVKNTDFVTDLKQTIQEGKDLYDKGGVATKQDIADVNTQLSDVEEKGRGLFYITIDEMSNLQNILNETGVLNLRPGTYVLPDTLEISNKSVVITSFASGVAMYGRDQETESHVVLTIKQEKPVLKLTNCHHSKLSNLVIKGYGETVNTVEIINSHWCIIEKCGFYNGLAGLYMVSSGGVMVYKCQFSTNIRGMHCKYVGDSDIEGCYFNTNGFSKNVGESEKYIGVGFLCENGNNNNIRGGKVEWNHRGIVIVATNGVNINGINFDYNRQNHISCVQYSKTTNEMYACKGINIVGNRFLGTTTFGKSSHIDIDVYDTSKILVSGNSFNASGPFAYDSCGADVDNPHHDVGPLRFVSVENRGGKECAIILNGNELSTSCKDKFLSISNHDSGEVRIYHDYFHPHSNYIYNGVGASTIIRKINYVEE